MDAFHTLAEVAVAVAGFSSLVIVFRGERSGWRGQDYVTLAFALCWSIGSVFLALLPIVLTEFGVELAHAARIGLFTTAAYMFLVGGVLMVIRRKVAASGGGASTLSPSLSTLFTVIVVVATSAGFGLLPGAVHAWYATIIALLIAHATGELGQLVIGVVKRPGAAAKDGE